MHDIAKHIAVWTMIALLTWVRGTSARAQTLQERGYTPVEQTHEDVDLLARSLQQQEPGLAATGEHHNVFKPLTGDRRLYYIGQGVIAQFDRSEYYLHRKAGVLQGIPPNTVFHIGLPKQTPPSDQVLPTAPDNRVARRIDARVQAKVNPVHPRTRALADFGRSPQTQTPPHVPVEYSPWHRFRSLRYAQLRVVTAALDQLTETESSDR